MALARAKARCVRRAQGKSAGAGKAAGEGKKEEGKGSRPSGTSPADDKWRLDVQQWGLQQA
eukprot:10850014-Alexandrium_andersonii.AAC.1